MPPRPVPRRGGLPALLCLGLLLWQAAAAQPGPQPLQQQLLAALRLGSVEGVQAALAAGADPNGRDASGWSPLMLAVAQRDMVIIDLLLQAGAAIDAVDEGGRTPLIEAAFGGSTAVVRHLLQAGADLEARDSFGRSARDVALIQGHQAVVELIDGAMAQQTADQAQAEAAARAAAQAELRALAARADEARRERLRSDLASQPQIFLAIARDTPPNTVREALELGADIGVLDAFGQSPLMYAAAGNGAEAISLLLQAGANAAHATETGWTALMIALRDNPDPAAVRALALAPQDLLARNEEGATMLDLAVARGDPTLVAFLSNLVVQANGVVAAPGQVGPPGQPGGPAQPQPDGPPVVEVPVTPVNPNPRPATPAPATPAAPATPGEASAATRALVGAILDGGTTADAQRAIEAGADLSSPYFNQTPLHWAIDRDRRDIARLLVASGARQSGGSWQSCGAGPAQVNGRVQGFLGLDGAGQAEGFVAMIDGFLWELLQRPALRRSGISPEQAIMGLGHDTAPLDALLALAVAWTGIDAASFDAQGRMGAGARDALYRFTFTNADGSLHSRRTAVSEANQRLLERAIALHVQGGRIGGCR